MDFIPNRRQYITDTHVADHGNNVVHLGRELEKFIVFGRGRPQ